MLAGSRIAIVVPARDEQDLIAQALGSIPAFVDEVVLVDDGSRDATVERARALGDPRLRVISHARSRGVGAAVATGSAHAFDAGADVVVVMAGDAQMDPDDLPALLAPVLDGVADYAKGNRLLHPGARRLMPLPRFLGNHVFSALTRMALGQRDVGDSQCGYTAMHRRVGVRVAWSRLWPGYGYPNDLLAQLRSLGARVTEVVVRPVYAAETSGVRLRHVLVTVPYVLARAYVSRLRTTRRSPIGHVPIAPQPDRVQPLHDAEDILAQPAE